MELRDVQSALNARGCKPPLSLDGWGPKTEGAVDALLKEAGATGFWDWSDARKELAAKQALAKIAGIETGEIDGLMGPQTRYAIEVWDGRQKGDKTPETWIDSAPPLKEPPFKSNWPRESEVEKFYGKRGENQTMLMVPYPMKLAWDKSVAVSRFSIHEKVHGSAERVLKRVLDHYGPAKIADLGLDLFGGCLNVRLMRGSTSKWSMHSYGIAIDFDPDRNQLKWKRAQARLGQSDAIKFWELWEAEGWYSLGRQQDRDFMHVEATRG